MTTRGRSFAAAGAAAAVCALVLGQRDLMRIGVLLLVVPLACALVLGRARYRLALTRVIDPPRVVAGDPARVRLEIENMTRLGTRVLLAEDHVPYALGAAPRFVLARLPGGQRAAVTYSVRSPVRGRFPIGPLQLRVTDPFGMCEVTRSFTATDPLVVVPRVWPLVPVEAGGQWSGSGESLARSAAASGEDDIATREYRHGDDLRRVHWRSTAHRGELMVRRDEQPRQMRATVLLDTRLDGHRGEGLTSSFEWAVSAAASVAVSLAGQRYGVRVLVDEHPSPWTTPYHADSSGHLLDRFALVETGPPQNLNGAVTALGRTGGDGLVVAVLGEIDGDLATGLARLGRQGGRGIALLLRTTDWAVLPPSRAAELDAERAHAAAVLGAGGWSVTECAPTENPATVWARVIGRGQPVRVVTLDNVDNVGRFGAGSVGGGFGGNSGNCVGSNGVGGNGVGSNGVGSNGVGSNGVGSNGVGSNGVGGNGVGGNGVGGNGVGGNGVGGNGVGGNGFGGNGVGGNGFGGGFGGGPAGGGR